MSLAIVILVFALAARPAAVEAQTQVSFTPLLTQLTLMPGSVSNFEVVVTNTGKVAPAEFSVYAADITQKPNGEYEVLPAGKSQYSCASWIKLSTQSLKVGPGSTGAVACTVSVPRSASGGRYAAIVLEMAPEPKRDTGALGSTAVVQRFVSVVELTVPTRTLQRRLDITGFTASSAADKPAYVSKYGTSALILTLQVSNPGTVHVFADARMILRDAAGKRLREIPLGSGRGIVLPASTVSMTSVLPAGLAAGDYTADVMVYYGGVRPATAKIPFTVDEGTASASKAEITAVIAPFSADPDEFDLTYPAGATAARSVVIHNRSDQTIRVTGRASALSYDSEGQIVLDQVDSPSSCAQWIKLNPEAVDIKPGAKQVVRMTIVIPKGEAGGKYANLVFTATPVDGVEGDAWAGETGTTITLRVGKEFITSGELSSITVEDGGPSVGRVFGTVFTNTGTIHVKPSTSVTIKRRIMPEPIPGIEYIGRGSLENVAQLNLGEELSPVLPGGTRELFVAMSGDLEPGDYVVEFLVNYGGETPLYQVHEFSLK